MKSANLFLALILSSSCFSYAQNVPSPGSKEEGKQKVETASARVEQVFNAMDDGFEQRLYLVKYHEKYVVVDDPLCSTDFAIGDKIYFLVLRHDMSESHSDGKKLLHFVVR